jgi:RNA polymerase sigma-70 factor (ECF subfamily)
LGRKKNGPNPVSLDEIEPRASNSKGPYQCVACDEEFENVYRAMALLPYEQKEAVILHLQGRMKFREIAKLQGTSIKTTLSRYSYGLDKLRSMLNSEVER